jgi:nitrite reductase/ring-hydroxylating ferredoxin subunit
MAWFDLKTGVALGGLAEKDPCVYPARVADEGVFVRPRCSG